MIKWAKEMTCSKCGNKFSHEFGDVVTPADVEFRSSLWKVQNDKHNKRII